jgi:hypothetical protein
MMNLGVQPALTRTCRLVREERLPKFYANSMFVAYIKDFDFDPLVHWCTFIPTSLAMSADAPVTVVHVKLLSRITCIYQLLNIVRRWRDIHHSRLHISIHNCITDHGLPTVQSFDQRALVVKAIELAENLRARRLVTEEALRFEFADTLVAPCSKYLSCRDGIVLGELVDCVAHDRMT